MYMYGHTQVGQGKPLLTPLHDDISILTVLGLWSLLGQSHGMEEQRIDLDVDGRGPVVGQQQLDVGERCVLKDVVLTRGGVSH